jgi:hypothetical protein
LGHHDQKTRIRRSPASEAVQVFGQGTTCDLDFKPGERYLVYAHQDPNTRTLSTNICSGTAPLADRTDHLTYLRGAANSSGGTASGDIMRDVNGNPEPIADAEITLVNGDRTFRGKADASGKFTLDGQDQSPWCGPSRSESQWARRTRRFDSSLPCLKRLGYSESLRHLSLCYNASQNSPVHVLATNK